MMVIVIVNPEFPINIVTLYICKIFAIQLKTVDAVLQAEQDIEYLQPNVRETVYYNLPLLLSFSTLNLMPGLG